MTAKEILVDIAVPVHIPNLMVACIAGMLAVITPVFAREQLHASDSVLGIIIGLNGLGAALFDIPAGVIVQRQGVQRTMVFGLLCIALGIALYAGSLNPAMLGFASAVSGVGASMFAISRHRFLREVVDSTKRGRMMSLVGGGMRWANAVGPAVAGWSLVQFGCRLTSLSLLALAAVSIACTAISNRVKSIDDKLRAESTTSTAVEHSVAAVISVAMRNKRVLYRVGGFSVLLLMLRSCRMMLLPLAALNMKLGATHAGMFLSVSFVFDAILFFAGGFIMDRWGRRFAAVPTSVALGLAFFVLSFATSTPLLYFSAVCFGVSNSLGSGLMLTIVADAVQGPDAPVMMSLLRLMLDIGQLVGPSFGGALLAWTNFHTTCIILLVVGIISAVWGGCLIDEPKKGVELVATGPQIASDGANTEKTEGGEETVEAAPVTVDTNHDQCGNVGVGPEASSLAHAEAAENAEESELVCTEPKDVPA